MFAVTARLNTLLWRRTSSGFAALLLATATLFPTASAAEPQKAQAAACGPREVIVERLAMSFGEEPIGIAVTATGDLLEVLASPEGNWSIIISQAGGPTCVMTAGDGWRGAPRSSVSGSGLSGSLPLQQAITHFQSQ